MAIMSRMRDSLPYVIVTLIILFVGMIVFEWGMDYLGLRGRTAPTSVGTVAGKEISYKEFEEVYQQAVQQRKQQDPNTPDDEAFVGQMRDQTWDQLVTKTLMERQMQKMDISASDDEVREMLYYNPPQFMRGQFTDSTGFFDQASYLSAIRNPGNDTIMLKVEDYIRDVIKQEKLQSALTASVRVTTGEAWEKFYNDNAKVDVNYVLFPSGTISDKQVSVSDDEIEKYYNEHAYLYRQKHQKKIKYAFFTLTPTIQDTLNVEKRINTLKEKLLAVQGAQRDSLFKKLSLDNSERQLSDANFYNASTTTPEQFARLASARPGDLIGPVRQQDGIHLYLIREVRDGAKEYVRAQHILVGLGTNKDSSRTVAEALMHRVTKENFSDLARQLSADVGSGQKGGELGYFERERMVKPFSDAAFAAKPGEIVGPVESSFGYHIIRTLDKTKKEFRYADIVLSVKPSTQAKTVTEREARLFVERARAGKIPFDTLAAQIHRRAGESDFFEKRMPVLGSQSVSTFAFESSVGDISNPITMRGGAFIVAEVATERKEGRKALELVKDEIKRKLLARKKAEVVLQNVTALRAKLSATDSLSVLKKHDSTVIIQNIPGVGPAMNPPGIGTDYAFNVVVYSLKDGETSQAIRGERGVYIIQRLSGKIPTEAEFNAQRDALATRLLSEKKNQFFREWLEKARQSAEIKDNREQFFR